MTVTLDIARDNPNAPTISAVVQSPDEDKPTLIGLSREELGEALGTIGVPRNNGVCAPLNCGIGCMCAACLTLRK